MMVGLVAENPKRMPNSWQYPPGLQRLDGLFGLGLDLPPVGVCKDSSGNVVDCGSQTGTGGPCDPTFVAMGYSCYVDATGQVTYVGPGGTPPPPAAGPPSGSSTGTGSGQTPAPGGKPQSQSSWQTWLLAAAVLVLAAKALS